MAKNDYVSDERLYLDKDGKVVGAKDPNRASLLVAAGGTIPYEDAEKYGLIKNAESEEAEAEVEEEEEEEGAEDESVPKAKKASAKKAPAHKK